jgi:DNA-binding CsgD family transcriptional regulator
MANSQKPRLRELRDIYLLVGECCELGADPLAWRKHMLQELARILGAKLTLCMEAIQLAPIGQNGWLRPLLLIDCGFNEAERAHLHRAVTDTRPEDSPWFSGKPFDLGVRHMTLCRAQMMHDAEWYRSVVFNDWYKPVQLDDALYAHHAPRPAQIAGILLQRALADKPFEHRQQRLLSLFWRECARLLGTKLATHDAPSVADLPPRLRQVLACLLEGDGEKQVASHLGLSKHTIHEYLKRLHERFGVSSRGELLARCHALWPALRQTAVLERWPPAAPGQRV